MTQKEAKKLRKDDRIYYGGSIYGFATLKTLNEAINYTHCCKSDSEQLCGESNLVKIKKLYTKVGDRCVEYKQEALCIYIISYCKRINKTKTKQNGKHIDRTRLK